MTLLEKIKLQKLTLVFKKTWQKMPLQMLIIFSTTILFLFRTYADFQYYEKDILNKIIFTFITTFFFSIGIYLLFEYNNFKIKLKKFSWIFSLIFGLLFYYSFDGHILQISFEILYLYTAITLVGIFSFIYIAPFIKDWINKKNSQEIFFNYAFSLSTKTIYSIGTGLIIMILGFIALFSYFSLFNFSNHILEDKILSTWTIFSLSFFTPIFFLFNFPNPKENKIIFKTNKIYNLLANYIALSAITIYFLILYAYSIKVLNNFSNWPNGKISWLVIAFSVFGYLVYFLVYITKENFKPAKIFQKYFPFLVLPQILMLFYAIFLRINQYDFTINRYLVVVFGIWLTIVSLYYIFSKKKYLGFTPTSLLILILLITFSGQFSVYNFPKNRQLIKLEEYLKEANILQGNKIVPLKDSSKISNILNGKIYGSIDYLCTNHGCKNLEKIFKKEIEEIKEKQKKEYNKRKKLRIENIKNDPYIQESEKKEEIDKIKKETYTRIDRWGIVYKLTNKINVHPYYRYYNDFNEDKYIFINSFGNFNKNFIKISGYDYYLKNINTFSLIEPPSSKMEEKNKKINQQKIYSTSFNWKNKELTFFKLKNNPDEEKEIIEIFDLKDILSKILSKLTDENKIKNIYDSYVSYKLNQKELTFALTGKNIDIKIFFDHIQILDPNLKIKNNQKNQKSDNNSLDENLIKDQRIHFEVLIREKNNI